MVDDVFAIEVNVFNQCSTIFTVENYVLLFTRRTALQAGAIGLLGLGMNHLGPLRALAAGSQKAPRAKTCIYIFLSGGLSQLDDGVTTVHDVSQIHHTPQHSDAAIQALFDTGRRAALGYFESAGGVAGNQRPPAESVARVGVNVPR